MKTLFFILMLLIPLHGLADIYKCKDSRQGVVYQDTPCTAARTLGTVKPVPAPSEKDALQARLNLERMNRDSRYFDQKRQAEWEKKREELRLLEAQEMQERERMAAEERDQYYIPAYGPGFRHRPLSGPHRHADPGMPTPRRDRPCVIGYIGDKSCH